MIRFLKKYSFSRSLVMAVACAQLVTATPDLSSGNANDMPQILSQAVTPYISQGYYIMHWQKAPIGTGYYVDLYHSNPEKLGIDRDDFNEASARGLGISVRKFIRAGGYNY